MCGGRRPDRSARMGAAAAPAVPDLIEMLGSERYLSVLAMQVLGSIGPEAHAAVPALIARLSDKNASTAASAGVALMRIDPNRRDLVEDRLRSMRATGCFYPRAMLAGGTRTTNARGRRLHAAGSPDARKTLT